MRHRVDDVADRDRRLAADLARLPEAQRVRHRRHTVQMLILLRLGQQHHRRLTRGAMLARVDIGHELRAHRLQRPPIRVRSRRLWSVGTRSAFAILTVASPPTLLSRPTPPLHAASPSPRPRTRARPSPTIVEVSRHYGLTIATCEHGRVRRPCFCRHRRLIIGAGAPLFEGLGRGTLELKQIRAVDAPGVTHIKVRSQLTQRVEQPARR